MLDLLAVVGLLRILGDRRGNHGRTWFGALYDHDGINEHILLDLTLGGRVRKALVRPERNGYVYIGPRYSVNSELQAFSPRDPGEPLDGIGQYMYPSRFDTSVRPSTANLPSPPTIPGT